MFYKPLIFKFFKVTLRIFVTPWLFWKAFLKIIVVLVKYIIHYFFTLNLFFNPLHLVLRNYMEMMFIIVDTSWRSWQLPAPPNYQSVYILHTASRRPVTGCSNCFASSENRWITWPRSREALNYMFCCKREYVVVLSAFRTLWVAGSR